jgi:hypothetical protein
MIRLTAHAEERMEEQGIALAWVEAAISAPLRSMPDPTEAILTRSWRIIPEFGGRALRVVHRRDGADVVVVTAHWDRGARL